MDRHRFQIRPIRAGMAWFFLTLVLCAPWPALGGEMFPDAVRTSLTSGASIRSVGVSSDGRLVVAIESSGARLLDAFSSTTWSQEDQDNVVPIACDSPVGVFIGGSTGAYAVQIPCEDGTVERFGVTESTDSGSALALEPVMDATGEPVVVDVGNLTDITAAAAGSGLLYVVGTDSGMEGYEVTTTQIYTLSVDATGDETAVSYTTFSNTTSIKALAARDTYGDLVAVSSSGDLFVLKEGYPASTSLVGCNDYEGTSPKQMLLLNDTMAAIIGSESVIYLATFGSDLPSDCEGYDWDLEDPVAMTRLTVAGDGSSADYLYVRAGFDDGNLGVFTTPTTPGDKTPLLTLETEDPSESADLLVSSSLARVYLGTSQGLSVLSAGPWLDVTLTEDQPVLMTEGQTLLTFTVTTDESVASCFDLSIDEPFAGGACEDNLGGAMPTASSPVVLTDVDLATVVSPGLNQIFVYGKDEDGNLGWTSFRVYYVSRPDKLEVTLVFGDQKLHLYIPRPDNEAIDDVQLLLKEGATESEAMFSLPDAGETLPAEFDTSSPVIVVEDPPYEYPEGGWPMSIGYVDNGDPGWTEVSSSQLEYTLYPLNNDRWYCLSVRAMAGSIEGDEWSDVACAKIQETQGASSAAVAPGFCLYSPTTCALAEPPSPARRGAPWGAIILPAVWIALRKRRQRGPTNR